MVEILRPALLARAITRFCVVLLIVGTACTARIAHINDYGDILNYERAFTGSDLAVGVSIPERPYRKRAKDVNDLLNRPFKSINLLVLNIKMKNIGEDRLAINRQDIALVTKDGSKFIPLSKDAAVAHLKGPLSIYRFLLLRKSIGYGYYAFGLDKRILLRPGEQKIGYLFYEVKSKYYDPAKAGEIRILFSRINLIGTIEYRLKTGEAKGK